MLRQFLRFCVRVTIGVVLGIAGLIGIGLYVGNSASKSPAVTPAVTPVAAISSPAPEPQVALELVGKPNGVVNEFGYMTITGRVKNNSSKNYTYAQITFIVTNNAGEQVGSALGNINNLQAGATWKFSAVSLAAGGTRFKLGSISGW